MATIQVAIKNSTSNNCNVHVYDRFGNGFREVDGSPFPLAEDATSPWFAVNADNDGVGTIDYRCDGGPQLGYIEVEDGETVEID